MQFHIADSFTAALARLSGQEQKQAKTAAFDLQLNPAHPGLQMHRLTNSRDPNFWSVRVNQDVRIIVHKTEASFMLAYVDHHDKAYVWAERRRIEAHPRTGAIQIVEVNERIEDAGPLFAPSQPDTTNAQPQPAPAPFQPVAPAIFANLTEDALLNIGAPADWTSDIQGWTEERFFQMSDRLPAEVGEALLDYAATGRLPTPEAAPTDPFAHPDTLRRVYTITSEDELRLALDFPWDKWSVFLHPSQRNVVGRDYSGPARVTGTAGTGKTIVALHRAARAVREDAQARVLLTSFSRPLANALRAKLAILLSDDPVKLARVSIASFEDAASELFQLATGRRPTLAPIDAQLPALERAIADLGYKDLPTRFVFSEWRQIVDAWNLPDVASYTNVLRIGRRTRLGSKQREALWPVFEAARFMLAARGFITPSQLFAAVEADAKARTDKPFTHVIVDEAQDLGVAELQMVGALASGPNAHFFAGDLGQRIFQSPFSWTGLGVDVRGRSTSLKVNYRMSRQIREAADKLLPSIARDAYGAEDDRTGAQSVFDGPVPSVAEFADERSEERYIAEFLLRATAEGIPPSAIGVFVRSTSLLSRARNAIAAAGLECRQLSERVEALQNYVSIGTMHFAKGLEFRAVVVMACDDEVLPLQSRVDGAADESELREVFDTERSLLYVACTRARDRLSLSTVTPVSEFFSDMGIEIGARL
ncbi:3'-5' exonuclease [Polymorphobacter fuscus]|uniref:DNA 3'-5' helicase n=1 Tax=Sandarakinorhabdus fusca TaxID=1439888 RepID=A0A7C9LHK6_9SPHN|nr:3'-5' exonuclease [Polymorphobacter fuscus]KAB7644407.1 AAA family ATPase [Polymorphobacter fuscus]MQT18327.1 AAA family ATPase [Polymorphobacter fuscus]NJC08226.1 mRNA-degrading endonuclease RelE of RelBE toxin-antitoxin system [Polymorphobacter fuscus]